MKKTVLFLILDQYADWESANLSTALKALSNEEIDIKTVSLSHDPIKTIGGFTTLPDFDLADVSEAISHGLDIRGIILVGGKSWKNPETKQLLPLLEKMSANGIVMGAICGASEFLGAFGFLNTVKHTSNGLESILSWENHIYDNAGNYIDSQSVRDGNIVTANGTAALDFAKDVLDALNLFESSAIEAWYGFNKIGYIEMMKGG